MAWHEATAIKAAYVFAIGIISAAWWWVKRRIGIVDDLQKRIAVVEENKVSYETLDKRISDVKETVSKGHKEIREDLRDMRGSIEKIYQSMPKE